jgi:hypothetical protein
MTRTSVGMNVASITNRASNRNTAGAGGEKRVGGIPLPIRNIDRIVGRSAGVFPIVRAVRDEDLLAGLDAASRSQTSCVIASIHNKTGVGSHATSGSIGQGTNTTKQSGINKKRCIQRETVDTYGVPGVSLLNLSRRKDFA